MIKSLRAEATVYSSLSLQNPAKFWDQNRHFKNLNKLNVTELLDISFVACHTV